MAVEGDERRVAHEAFKSVAKMDRDHVASWAQLARLNKSEGRIAKAFFARVNKQAPWKTGYMMNLATALVFNGDIEEAADLFTEVPKDLMACN